MYLSKNDKVELANLIIDLFDEYEKTLDDDPEIFNTLNLPDPPSNTTPSLPQTTETNCSPIAGLCFCFSTYTYVWLENGSKFVSRASSQKAPVLVNNNQNLFGKLQVKSRTEAIKRARELGIL